MDETGAVVPYPEGQVGSGGPSSGLIGALERVLHALLPAGTAYWEVHCHVRREENGCTDIQVHTCTQRQDAGKTADPAPHGGYL